MDNFEHAPKSQVGDKGQELSQVTFTGFAGRTLAETTMPAVGADAQEAHAAENALHELNANAWRNDLPMSTTGEFGLSASRERDDKKIGI